MGQPWQPPPQEPQEPPHRCFPAFLSLTIFVMIKTTTDRINNPAISDARFACSQGNICNNSFLQNYGFLMTDYFTVSLVLSL